MMKAFAIKVILFIVFSTFFYVFMIPMWKKFAPARFSPNINYKIGAYGHLHSRLKDLSETEDVEILFLGSSHAYRGFDTRIFLKEGIKTFNLGSSAQTPLQTSILLKRYLDKVQPKLIIYEVYPNALSSDGIESSLDLIANDENDLYSLVMTFELEHIKVFNTFIYAGFKDVFNFSESFNESINKEDDKYVKGGYVEREIEHYTPESLLSKEIVLNKKQLNEFENIVGAVQKRGIKLVLVYAPIPTVNYSRYTNNNYFDSLMTTYSEYYNFNEILDLNDSLHFYDSHHLNQLGVNIFNEMLIEILKELKHRD